MKIFFSVGEPSGDIHGANLIRALKSAYAGEDLHCVGFGGPKMRDAGAELLFDLTSLAVMWFGRVLLNIRTFFKLADQAEEYFKTEKPDAVVLIDYPGFNWHIAKRAHEAGIPVYYYSPPQIWGWGQWRIKKVQKWVDCILSGLSFETQWYKDRGCNCVYVGHPFFDEVTRKQELVQGLEPPKDTIQIGILPGSRTQEVEQNMKTFVKAARRIQTEYSKRNSDKPNISDNPSNKLTFRVAAFKEAHRAIIEPMVAKSGLNIEVCVGKTPEIMATSTAVMSVSGSVSLELLYHQTPTVILYKVCRLGMFLQGFFRKVKYITLVNLLEYGAVDVSADDSPDAPNPHEALFPEFLTSKDESVPIASQILTWIFNPEEYQNVKSRLANLKEKVCQPGAAQKATEIILARGLVKE